MARPADYRPFSGALIPKRPTATQCASLQNSSAFSPRNCSPVTLFKYNGNRLKPNYPACYFYSANDPYWGKKNALLIGCIISGYIPAKIDQKSLDALTGGFLDELCALQKSHFFYAIQSSI